MVATVINLSEWREKKRIAVSVEFDPFWFHRWCFTFWFGGNK